MITYQSAGGVLLVVITLLFVVLFGSLNRERKEKKKLVSSQLWRKSQFAYFNDITLPPEGYPLTLAVGTAWPQAMCNDLKYAIKKIAGIKYRSMNSHPKTRDRWVVMNYSEAGDDLRVMWTKIALLCGEFHLNRYNVRLVRFKETYGVMIRTSQGDYFFTRDSSRVMTLREADLLLTLKAVECPGSNFWTKYSGVSIDSYDQLRKMTETN